MSCVSTRQVSWLSTRHTSCVSTTRHAQCSEPPQRRRPSAASTKGGGLRPPPFVVSFVMALNKAHVLALNTAHVLRLNKADVLALNKAHVLRLNNKICPVFRANTKETTKGGGRSERASQSSFLVEFVCPGDHFGCHFGRFGSPGPHLDPKRAQGPQNV